MKANHNAVSGIKFGISSNIFTDQKLTAVNVGPVSIFPTVYYLDNKKVFKTENIDASNIDEILVAAN